MLGANYLLLDTAEPDDLDLKAAIARGLAYAPYADLLVSDVTCQELLIGDPVDLTVSWTVTNMGTGPRRVDGALAVRPDEGMVIRVASS